MNTGSTIAPPPALRRRRPLRTEPLIFTVLLTLLTLGINLSGAPSHEDQATKKPVHTHIASVH